jgi:XTP/dITP diphosphohydrolase
MNQFKQVLVASGNKGKLVEIAELLGNLGIKALGSFDYNLPEPDEDGQDFAENSLIKAKYYGDKTGLISLADDSGLGIDLLNGEPGIHSARWAVTDGQKDFPHAFEKIKSALIEKGADLAQDKISAYFICNLSIYDPKTKFSQSFEGRIDGILTFPARGNNGFGYDPIFIPQGLNQTFGEIDPKIKEKISHRALAFDKFAKWYK